LRNQLNATISVYPLESPFTCLQIRLQWELGFRKWVFESKVETY